jgi:diamine N-acetyltransferase
MSTNAETLATDSLKGEFVRLRPLDILDAEITCRWRNDTRAVYLNRTAESTESQARWIESRPTGEFNFVIELKSGQPVGMLSLLNLDLANRHAESGRFLIGDENAAKGAPVAAEAMKLLYQLAFETLNLHRIHGLVNAQNTLMIKWQKYLGMREEGRLREHYWTPTGFADAVALGLLEKDYRAMTLPRMNGLIALGRRPTVRKGH